MPNEKTGRDEYPGRQRLAGENRRVSGMIGPLFVSAAIHLVLLSLIGLMRTNALGEASLPAVITVNLIADNSPPVSPSDDSPIGTLSHGIKAGSEAIAGAVSYREYPMPDPGEPPFPVELPVSNPGKDTGRIGRVAAVSRSATAFDGQSADLMERLPWAPAGDRETFPPVIIASAGEVAGILDDGFSGVSNDGWIKARAITMPKPKYPFSSRKRGEEGTAVFSARVEMSGEQSEIRMIESSGYPLLDRAARQALERTVFSPARRDGSPVASLRKFAFTFRLQEGTR